MRTRLSIAVFLLAALVSASASAETIGLRMVRASNTGGAGGGAGLGDVMGILRNSLPYKHYSLVASGSVSLPGRPSATLAGFHVSCKGPPSALVITVRHGRKTVLSTTLRNMVKGRPFIVGGFPDKGGGKLVLIFALR
jgi:hypothetical protein